MAERVTPGQKFRTTPFFRADVQNRTLETVEWFHSGDNRGPTATPGDGLFSSAIVKVKNLTGADRARGEVVQLGAYLLTVVDPRRPWFEGNTLAAPAFRLALLRAPIKSTKIGEAQLVGRCAAMVNVANVSHTHAIPVDGTYVLGSADFGPFVLLSQPDGTGEQEMLVFAGAAVDESRLDLTEELSAGGSASGDYLEFTGGNWAATGRTYDVFDSLGTLVVASGDRVFAQWDPRSMRLEAKQGECS